ncbi:MAG: hypothetical protein ACJLS3_13970 [Erythrobacter sp.]
MSEAGGNRGGYGVPDGVLGLVGPVAKPAPGTLPLRGDLAHMALAGTHLAAHYVIPHPRIIAAAGANLHLAPREDAAVHHHLPAGTAVELLDIAGEWAWVCLGPQGPSGYCLTAQLAAESAAA